MITKARDQGWVGVVWCGVVFFVFVFFGNQGATRAVWRNTGFNRKGAVAD